MHRVLLVLLVLFICGSAIAENVETTWTSWYTGTGNTEEDGYDIDIDSYGNVYVVGRAIVTYGAYDYSLVTVKIDPDGDTVWTKRFLPFGYQWAAVDHFAVAKGLLAAAEYLVKKVVQEGRQVAIRAPG